MKKYIPLASVVIFVAVILFMGNILWTKKQEVVQAVPALPTLVVYTDIPVDAANAMANAFSAQQHVTVQMNVLAEDQILQGLKNQEKGKGPDLILASEEVLQEAAKQHYLKPYISEETDLVMDPFKDPAGDWVGVWYDPIVFVVSDEYFKKHNAEVRSWNNLITLGMPRVAMTDLVATKSSANLLYTLVEVYGEDESLQFLQKLQRRVVQYTKYLITPVRMTTLDEADVAIANGNDAWRYVKEKFPVKVVYPEEGTAYYLTGAGVVSKSDKQETAASFVKWLLSKKAQEAMERQQFYYVFFDEKREKLPDSLQHELVLYPVAKKYTDQGKDLVMSHWIEKVRFGKDR